MDDWIFSPFVGDRRTPEWYGTEPDRDTALRALRNCIRDHADDGEYDLPGMRLTQSICGAIAHQDPNADRPKPVPDTIERHAWTRQQLGLPARRQSGIALMCGSEEEELADETSYDDYSGSTVEEVLEGTSYAEMHDDPVEMVCDLLQSHHAALEQWEESEQELRDERDGWQREYEKLRAAIEAECTHKELRQAAGIDETEDGRILPGSDLGKGRINLAHWSVKVLAIVYRDYLEQEGGENYVEMQLTDPRDRVPFTVTLRRNDGETPSQKANRLQRERDRLRTEIIHLWDANTLTEGQVASILGVDRVEARRIRDETEPRVVIEGMDQDGDELRIYYRVRHRQFETVIDRDGGRKPEELREAVAADWEERTRSDV